MKITSNIDFIELADPKTLPKPPKGFSITAAYVGVLGYTSVYIAGNVEDASHIFWEHPSAMVLCVTLPHANLVTSVTEAKKFFELHK